MKARTFRIQSMDGARIAFKACWTAFCGSEFGTGFELVLQPLKSKRSQSQNRLYWALLRQISAVVWIDGKQYSDVVWHEYFARMFIGSSDLPSGGKVAISTTTLSIEEFGNYITQIEQWAAELGYPLDR